MFRAPSHVFADGVPTSSGTRLYHILLRIFECRAIALRRFSAVKRHATLLAGIDSCDTYSPLLLACFFLSHVKMRQVEDAMSGVPRKKHLLMGRTRVLREQTVAIPFAMSGSLNCTTWKN